MIISLRGTNGSGKSTIVRRIMEEYPVREEVRDQSSDRRKPIGYLCFRDKEDFQGLMVPGHYEIANGGIDTLRDLDQAYSMIRAAARLNHHVLYEGKNMSDGTNRLVRLRLDDKLDCRAVLVSFPLEDCVAAVRARGHSIRVETIEKLYRKSFRDVEVLRDLGVRTEVLPRTEALNKVREWLCLVR